MPRPLRSLASTPRAVLVLPAALWIALSGCGAETNAGEQHQAGGVAGGRGTERSETPVVVERLERGAVRDEVVASATVDARRSVQVFPKLANLPITEVFVDEGERVERGSPLMQLYDTDLKLAARVADTAKSEAAKTVETRKLVLEEDERRVLRAERQANKAKSDLARLTELVNEGLVTKQEADDAQLTADTAADDLALANFASRGAQLQLELAEIARERAELDWEQSNTNLEEALVTAPLTGIVARRECDVGELSNLSTPAFTVVDIEELVLNLRMPQDTLAVLARGQHVDVRAVTHTGKHFEGEVRIVNQVLDEATGAVPVIVDLQPAEGLVPGLFCEARVVTAERQDALLVSKRAVLYEDDQPVIFVVDVIDAAGDEGQDEQEPVDDAADAGATQADGAVIAADGAEEDDGTATADALEAGPALSVDRFRARKVLFVAGVSTPTQIEILTDLEGRPLSTDLRVVVVGQENLKDGDLIKIVEDAF